MSHELRKYSLLHSLHLKLKKTKLLVLNRREIYADRLSQLVGEVSANLCG
jgi:hypothetical protein